MRNLFPAFLSDCGRRWALLAGLFLAMACFSGCALWKADLWNLDRYRDDRAVDIEHHLNRDKPVVANPF